MRYPRHELMLDAGLESLIFHCRNEFDENIHEAEALEAAKVLIGRTDRRIAKLEKGLREMRAVESGYGDAMFADGTEYLNVDALNARIDALLPKEEKSDE